MHAIQATIDYLGLPDHHRLGVWQRTPQYKSSKEHLVQLPVAILQLALNTTEVKMFAH
jgi:hypothetical protein